jgi:hypothetical protein
VLNEPNEWGTATRQIDFLLQQKLKREQKVKPDALQHFHFLTALG